MHYNTARPHRSLGQLTPAQADGQSPEPVNLANHRIRHKQILGGLTREYYIAALPPRVATESPGHRPESYFRVPQAPVIATMLGYSHGGTAQVAAEAGSPWSGYAPGDHARP